MVFREQIEPEPRRKHWNLEPRDQRLELLERTGQADTAPRDDHRTLSLREKGDHFRDLRRELAKIPGGTDTRGIKSFHALRFDLRGLDVEGQVNPHRTATRLPGEMDRLLQVETDRL